MKKLLLILLAGLFTTSLLAQVEREENDKKKKKCENPFYGTIGGGFGAINGDSESYDSPLFGGFLGVGFCVTQLSPYFSLRGELGYSLQGSGYGEMYGDGKVRLGYVALPVFVRGTAKSGFFGEVGVRPAVLTSAKDVYDGESYDYKDYINGFDFGALVGVGYQFGRFGVGARVVQGVTNINKDTDEYKDRNFSGNLSFTVSF